MRDFRVSKERATELQSTIETYSGSQDPKLVEHFQLKKFNEVWSGCSQSSPFYKYWTKLHDLPNQIESLSELQNFPVLTKAVLQEHVELVFDDGDLRHAYETGGSTSEPTRFPAGEFEGNHRFADNYVGRAWWNIAPYDRSALIWGHSHLYGSGLSRIIKRLSRSSKDLIGQTLRLDGYQQSAFQAKSQLDQIIKYRPTHLVGYTSALVRIARVADISNNDLKNLQLKGIICTADSLDEADEVLLQKTFSCPIIVEYGAAETGVIAVSRERTRNIQVLWASHLVMLNSKSGSLLTTLKPRKFPLINYELGDQLKPNEIGDHGSIISIHSIEGRTDSVLCFRSAGGAEAVGVLQLTHILKGHSTVESVQFSQEADDTVNIYVRLSDESKLPAVSEQFKKFFIGEYPTICPESFKLIAVQHQEQSKSGKHLVIRPSSASS